MRVINKPAAGTNAKAPKGGAAAAGNSNERGGGEGQGHTPNKQ